MKILVTGAAGFIGFATSRQLLERGDTVVGLDNFNDYYDVSLKEARAAILDEFDAFSMVRIDLADRAAMDALLAGQAVTEDQKPSIGCNIKWKAGQEPEHAKA